MAIQVQLRLDTAANWEAVNPILAQGEQAMETDTKKEKIGDGVTPWNDLPYRNLGGLGGDGNYDGGAPDSIYLPSQTLDGGEIS